MELVEKYFGDGSQSSIEARVYLEDYMERVRELFVAEIGGTDEALEELSRVFPPKVATERMLQYGRNRAIFVDRVVFGKTYAALARKYNVTPERARQVVFWVIRRLKSALLRERFAKKIARYETVIAMFCLAFSDKDDWSDWLAVRKKRDFMYV